MTLASRILFWSRGEEQYRFLSNFYPCELMFIAYEESMGRTRFGFPSVEHAYQAGKCKDWSWQKQFMIPTTLTPAQAKKLGRGIQKESIDPNWEIRRVKIMELLLRKKFESETLAEALLSTGDAELIHYSKNDKFWGSNGNEGENKLGEILMRIRKEMQLRQQKPKETEKQPEAKPNPFVGKVVTFTGHRPPKLGGYDEATFSNLVRVAKEVISKLKPKLVITGMALGWDQAVAMAAQELGVPYEAYIPFPGQETVWKDAQAVHRYRWLLDKAAEVKLVNNQKPFDRRDAAVKLQMRNEAMVLSGEVVVALHDGSSGGTANCIEFAKRVNKPIVNCWSLFQRMKG